MNIFAIDKCPKISAMHLPDKLLIKMPIESAQMLALVISPWYLGLGTVPKKAGGFYTTDRGAFRNHPCTRWAASSKDHWTWLLEHGLELCAEFRIRYNKEHSCEYSLKYIEEVIPKGNSSFCNSFIRAMPDVFRYDLSIDDNEAYRRYLVSKKWPLTNYQRKPERMPEWMKKYIL